jgi:hypothetical protein
MRDLCGVPSATDAGHAIRIAVRETGVQDGQLLAVPVKPTDYTSRTVLRITPDTFQKQRA